MSLDETLRVLREVREATNAAERSARERARRSIRSDEAAIEQMAKWRHPRGALSRQMLKMQRCLDELEAEVRELRAALMEEP